MSKSTAIVLYNKIDETSPEDVIDGRTQAEWIAEVLEELNYNVIKMQFTTDCIGMLEKLNKINENLIVINLVDAAPEEENLTYLVPAILDYLKVKYTGCSHDALYLTTNKVYTKRILQRNHIPTPEWIYGKDDCKYTPGKKYIIKALSEDASIGICDESILIGENFEMLQKAIHNRESQEGKPFFAEQFVDGREFGVCIFGDREDPTILPPYEWIFDGFDEKGMEKIMNYDAKWTENTYEYDNIYALYNSKEEDKHIIEEMVSISRVCWDIFKLKGHVRIDFRVDSEGKPWVLEINCNPSFYGFHNIAKSKGMEFNEILRRIVEAV